MTDRTPVVTADNLGQFFFEAIDEACHRQHLELADETRLYLVRLLEHFTHPRALTGATRRTTHRALALMLADATRARHTDERRDCLRQIGDVALFVAGFFPGSLRRKAVDVDYYVGMGGTAYGLVADLQSGARRSSLRRLFGELAEQFGRLVELLDDLLAESPFGTCREDALRMHEAWLGSQGAVYGGRLAAIGVTATASRARH